MPINFIEQVGSYAADIDGVIVLIALLVTPWLIACEALLFYFVIRFRARDGVKAEYLDGSNPKHKRWITIPHMLVLVCDIFVIWAAIVVWVDVKQELPEPDATVRIISQQWAWTFQHPGVDGEIGTDDDVKTVEELHVVQGKVYHFELFSRDVMHSFSVPVFRLKQDAVPGRMIKGWFKADKLGTYDIQCAEMCGIGHGVMYGRIVIETEARHKIWLADNPPPPPVPKPVAAPVKAEPVKAEPVKAEPVKAEPVKAEPVKAEPAQAAVKAEPVKDADKKAGDNSKPPAPSPGGAPAGNP